MNLKEIKNQVQAHYAKQGKTAKSLVNELVKEITNGGDLRKKSTWEYALTLLNANKVEPIKSVQKTLKPVKPAIVESKVVTNQQIDKAAKVLESLPLREIAPNTFITEYQPLPSIFVA